MQPKYRSDIDGLRAIAVLSVVGFHASPLWVRGGLVGVDIFFVISGYLISTIIFGSLEQRSFSFIEFYSRRINRIFPALLLVLIVSYAFGWFALLADEYKQLGKHIAGGAGFVSNFVLWNESGYFDNAADTKPLLHLWSLGIEEQFYIIWPLLLWLTWKLRLNPIAITIAGGLISFALNVGMIQTDAVATFYSPQTRFWELSAGSVLAFLTLHKPDIFSKFGRVNVSVRSLLGVALIAVSILAINKERAFPGWWAVLPTAATVLIISAGAGAWPNRVILSNRVLVWFGLISYPLYLWHWPLLSFARIVESEELSRGIRIAAVLSSIALAWLTYIFIEKPIRAGKRSKAKTASLLLAMIAVGFFGYNCYTSAGYIFRPTVFQQVVKYDGDIGHDIFWKYLSQNFYRCAPIQVGNETLNWDDSIRCHQSKKDTAIKMVIIGDSHAEHLFLGLAEELSGINVTYYTKGALPFFGDKDFAKMFRHIIDDKSVSTVILSAYWHYRLQPKQLPESINPEIELDKVVNALTAANKRVYIADDVPDFSFQPKKCKYERSVINKSNCLEPRAIFDGENRTYYPILESAKKNDPNVQILRTGEYFCSVEFCSMAIDGRLMYRQTNHLNINGSKYLAKKIIENNPSLAN